MGPGLLPAGDDPEKQALVDQRSQGGAIAGLLQMPVSPMAQYANDQGTGKVMGKQFLDAMTGGWFRDALFPDYASDKAQYALDVKDYAAQQKMMNTAQFASNYQGALSDDDPTNDLAALQQAAIYQPDVYGPVLRDMMQGQINPDQETMFAPDYQMNPETGEWEMVQTGNQGTTTRTDMGEGFIPESRMWSPDAREAAIGEADAHIRNSEVSIEELSALGKDLLAQDPEEWRAGWAGELEEGWKEATGAQDKKTLILKKYTQIRNAMAVQNLPPGVASDKDIEMVLEGFPARSTDPLVLAEYVQAMERAERKIKSYHQFQSQWLNEKGTRAGMSTAWKNRQQEMKEQQGSPYYDPVIPEKDQEAFDAWKAENGHS